MANKKYFTDESLKAFVNGIKTYVSSYVNNAISTKANVSHTHAISDVTNLQSQLDGKAASSHNHSASNITSGILSTDRLSTIPISKGGTGATTASAALVNLGLTATASELNILDGITATTKELNYVDGVTSNIQTQLNSKLSLSGGTITGPLAVNSTNTSGNGLIIRRNSSTSEQVVHTVDDSTYRIKYTNDEKSNNIIFELYNSDTEGSDGSGKNTSTVTINGSLSGSKITASQFSGSLSGNATSATKATQDASGNTITSTYETKTDATSKLTQAKAYTDEIAATKAASSHNHSTSNITSGTLSSDRLPTVPISKGGTGATTAASALTNLGITATSTELNKLDGVTASTAEINKLKGLTATTTELNYVDGVTANIQTQLNSKSATSHTHNYAGSSSAGGVATSANKLATARNIGNISFDGTANISAQNICGYANCTGSTDANANKYTKFARITLEGAYSICAGSFLFTPMEGNSVSGMLNYYLRNSSTVTSTSINLYWQHLTNLNYEQSVVAVKVSDGIFDLYYKTLNTWDTMKIININCNDPQRISMVSNTGWVVSVTAASTSSINSNVSYAKYAASATNSTNATTATKLGTSAGSAIQPVYFSGGKPVATTYTLEASVPSGAKFTDTNTWRGIQNNLTSTSTTDSLSANQGKVLKDLVDTKANSSHIHNYAGSSSAGGAANSAIKLATARTIFGKSFDGSANVEGQALLYGTYTDTASGRYSKSGIQIRENGLVGSAQSDIGYAPSIGFHWGGKIAATMLFHSDGNFYLRKQDGTSRASLDANLLGNASSATTASTATTLTGLTSTVAELNYVDGVTSNIQTQLNGKAASSHKHGTVHSDFTVALPSSTTGGWNAIDSSLSATGGHSGFILKSIRTNASSPSWILGNYAAGIAFGGADTKGVISTAYNSPSIKFAGGNGSAPVWNLQITGVSGGNYNLDNFPTKTGTGASGTWGINISGNASTATSATSATKAAQDGSGNTITSTYLKLSGGTMSGTINSSKVTSTYLQGNSGGALINSTASAGGYVMVDKTNSTNGYFTRGTYQGKHLLQYTAKSTVDAGTNGVTKSVTLLDESGNASFPATVTSSTFSGTTFSGSGVATVAEVKSYLGI